MAHTRTTIPDLVQRFGAENAPPSESRSEDGLREVLASMLDKLIPVAAPRLEISAETLRERASPITLSLEPGLNAAVHQIDRSARIHITVNRDLMMFLFEMSKLFASRVGLWDPKDPEPLEEPLISWESAVDTTHRLLKDFVDGHFVNAKGFETSELTKHSCTQQWPFLTTQKHS